jgi:hypothetical protein
MLKERFVCKTNEEFWKAVEPYWDYEKNINHFTEYSYGAEKKIWIKCLDIDYHESNDMFCYSFSDGVRCCHCCNRKVHPKDSFAQFNINIYGEDFLERYWDYDLNIGINPYEISPKSSKKVWIKCQEKEYHQSYDISCSHFVGGRGCPYCSHKSGKVHPLDSFAQHHIDNTDNDFLIKYWDWENKNKLNINPWEISIMCNQKVYIFCQEKEYHESYLVTCAHFADGKRCGYCGNMKTHPLDSFAKIHIDTYGNDFLDKYWSTKNIGINPWDISPCSGEQIWIKCQDTSYHEDYKVSCANFLKGKRCPCCHNKKIHPLDSLGVLFPRVLGIWSDKNMKTAYEFSPNSNQKLWFKCECGKHEDYFRTPNSSNRSNFNCPECVRERDESFLQEKTRLYLNKLGYEVLHEYHCNIIPNNPKTKGANNALPYDNEVEGLKLIIEVHGEQHYKISHFHKLQATQNHTTPEYEFHKQQVRDRYKIIYAKSKGYSFLEIPYWTEKDESYKQLIENKIQQLNNTLN